MPAGRSGLRAALRSHDEAGSAGVTWPVRGTTFSGPARVRRFLADRPQQGVPPGPAVPCRASQPLGYGPESASGHAFKREFGHPSRRHAAQESEAERGGE